MANFSLVSLTQIGLLLVLICWTTGSNGAAFSLEEEFKQLKENYNQMKEMVKNLESKVTELRTELESKDVQMQGKVTELEAKVEELVREKKERTAAADYSKLAKKNQLKSAINGLPSSCGDLKMIGHIWSGFYSVMGSAMMESVYCDFTKHANDTGFQKWIGYVDVKSAPVHFYVQRNSYFNASTTIPFQLARLNEGNAMNLTSGIFTAPRPGIYFFSFTGLVEFPASSSYVFLKVSLYLNGGLIGTVRAGDANTVVGQFSPLSTLQSTLNLNKGDQVWVGITGISSGTSLAEGSNHNTHFTGFILEEEIVASL